MIEKAKLIAAELLLRYIPRNKQSVKRLHDLYRCDCLIVGKERLELVPFALDQAFFFHPNSASFRIKRLKRGVTKIHLSMSVNYRQECRF